MESSQALAAPIEPMQPAQALASHTEQWQRLLWGVAALALIAAFAALLWFSLDMLTRLNELVGKSVNDDRVFLFSAVGLTHSTLLRLMGIFAGTAVSFAGLMISFFTHAKETRLSLASGSGEDATRAGLATYSPGIVGIVVGAAIVVAALYDKSNFDFNGLSGNSHSGSIPTAQHKLPTPQDAWKELNPGVPDPSATEPAGTPASASMLAAPPPPPAAAASTTASATTSATSPATPPKPLKSGAKSTCGIAKGEAPCPVP